MVKSEDFNRLQGEFKDLQLKYERLLATTKLQKEYAELKQKYDALLQRAQKHREENQEEQNESQPQSSQAIIPKQEPAEGLNKTCVSNKSDTLQLQPIFLKDVNIKQESDPQIDAGSHGKRPCDDSYGEQAESLICGAEEVDSDVSSTLGNAKHREDLAIGSAEGEIFSNNQIKETVIENYTHDEIAGTFSCNICQKVIKRRRYLASHLISHSDRKKFQCSLCLTRFKFSGSLRNHMKKFHIENEHINSIDALSDALVRQSKRLASHQTVTINYSDQENYDYQHDNDSQVVYADQADSGYHYDYVAQENSENQAYTDQEEAANADHGIYQEYEDPAGGEEYESYGQDEDDDIQVIEDEEYQIIYNEEYLSSNTYDPSICKDESYGVVSQTAENELYEGSLIQNVSRVTSTAIDTTSHTHPPATKKIKTFHATNANQSRSLRTRLSHQSITTSAETAEEPASQQETAGFPTSLQDSIILEDDSDDEEVQEAEEAEEEAGEEEEASSGDITEDSGLQKSIPCIRCKKSFVGMTALVRHARVCGLKCHLCGITFSAIGGFGNHMKKTHKISHWKSFLPQLSPQFVCENCNIRFKTHQSLANHKKYCELVEKAKKPPTCMVYCPVCKARVQNQFLNEHMRFHPDQDGQKNRNSSKEDVKQKVSFHKVACEICHKVMDKSHLDSHMLVHVSRELYQCQQCPKSYKYLKGLKEHVQIHEISEGAQQMSRRSKRQMTEETSEEIPETAMKAEPFLVEITETDSIKLELMEAEPGHAEPMLVEEERNHGWHFQGGNSNDSFRDSFERSGTYYPNSNSDEDIVFVDLVPSGSPNPTPKESSVETEISSEGLIPELIHDNPDVAAFPPAKANFKCSHCPTSFKKRSKLTRHMDVHTQKQFSCELCHKGFVTVGELEIHEKVHQHVAVLQDDKLAQKELQESIGPREKMCRKCDKVLNSYSSLKEHVVTHIEAKPYKCTLCGTAYRLERQAHKHVQKHLNLEASSSDVVLFPCRFCSQQFTEEQQLKLHLLVHKEDEESYSPVAANEEPASQGKEVSSESWRFFSNPEPTKASQDTVNNAASPSPSPVETYKCLFCPSVFDDQSKLQRHFVRHSQMGFGCQFCYKRFKIASELKDHEELHQHITVLPDEKHITVLPDEKKDQEELLSTYTPEDKTCRSCGKTYMYNSALLEHLVSHSTARPYKCNMCNSAHKTKHQAKSHVRTAHLKRPQEGQITCHVCHTTLESALMKGHMKEHGFEYYIQSPFQCSLCPSRFSKLNKLNSHLKIVHKKSDEDQASAEKNTVQNSTITKDIGGGVMKTRQVFSCDLCPESFIDTDEFNSHKTYHAHIICDRFFTEQLTNLDPFENKCPICLLTLSNNFRMKEHLPTHFETHPYQCLLCKRRFKMFGVAKAHLTEEHQQNTFRCASCPSILKTAIEQKYHTIMHDHIIKLPVSMESNLELNDRSQKTCPLCQRTFICHSHVVEHMMSHTTARPYKCRLCDNTYKLWRQAKDHLLRTHFQDELHPCQFCNATLVTQELLKAHVKRKHKKQTDQHNASAMPFRCKVCGRCFSKQSNLSRHEHMHEKERIIEGEEEEKPTVDAGELSSTVNSYQSEVFQTSIQNDNVECTQQTHAKKPKTKIWRCDKCPKTFTRHSLKMIHRRYRHLKK